MHDTVKGIKEEESQKHSGFKKFMMKFIVKKTFRGNKLTIKFIQKINNVVQAIARNQVWNINRFPNNYSNHGESDIKKKKATYSCKK